MIKLIALYRRPDDVAAFEEHYYGVHLPLVRAIPGLRKLEITKVSGSPIGEEKYHLVTEMVYDSAEAMDAANASPEGKAAARDLLSFAPQLVTLIFGEIQA